MSKSTVSCCGHLGVGSRIVGDRSVNVSNGTDKLNHRNCYNPAMNTCKCHRFPPDRISYAVWLYYRFNLSHRAIEDLLAERGITVSPEFIRLWCNKFGATEPIKVRARAMRKFTSVRQAQRVLGAHPAVSDLFNLARHLVRAQHSKSTSNQIGKPRPSISGPYGNCGCRMEQYSCLLPAARFI